MALQPNGSANTLCGGHRSNENAGTTLCSGHRAACPSHAPISWTDAIQTGIIYASQVEELRQAIRAEVARWNVGNPTYPRNIPLTEPDAVAAGQPITNETYNNLSTMVYRLNGSTPILKNDTSDLVDDANWDALITQYNLVRQNCMCNSDCSCNAICACYGDCGCNYSDVRLKENVEFVEQRNGLNIYSWNYVWDKTKRHVGVLAQELFGTQYASALVMDKNGYYMVNYKMLPI